MRYRYLLLAGLLIAIVLVGGCALFDQAPTANFTWSPQDPLARKDVQFTDLSTDSGGLFGGGGVVSWSWDFGDNGFSPLQNPKHKYAKSGTYPVKLTVTDGSGNSSTVQKTVTVTPSLDGVWKGFIVNGGVTDRFELDFHHSSSGGISGTVVYKATVYNASSITFDDVTKVVSFQVPALGIRLEGTLDASEKRITGYWYVLGTPTQGLTWDVTLQ